MGSVVSSIFGGTSGMPDIPVSDPIPAPEVSATIDPVSQAVRKAEEKKLKARRAFAGTLLTGEKKEKQSLL